MGRGMKTEKRKYTKQNGQWNTFKGDLWRGLENWLGVGHIMR